MSAKDAHDAVDAGDVVHYGHPPKNTRFFLTPRGDAQKAAKNRLSKSANPSPLIRVGPAWRSAKVRHVVGGGSAAWGVGGMGRTALYLKVGPAGLGLRRCHGPRGQWPDFRAAAQAANPWIYLWFSSNKNSAIFDAVLWFHCKLEPQ